MPAEGGLRSKLRGLMKRAGGTLQMGEEVLAEGFPFRFFSGIQENDLTGRAKPLARGDDVPGQVGKLLRLVLIA